MKAPAEYIDPNNPKASNIYPITNLAFGTDKFYLSLFGMVSGRDARHRRPAGLVHQALQTSQVLSFRETLFCGHWRDWE